MPIEQAGQAPHPLIPGYQKLSDFVQTPKGQFRETQEFFVIPRMKLPAVNMTTGESVVPWVTTWSNKEKTSSIPMYTRREQIPYIPLPAMLSDIETLHLPITPYLEATSQPTNHINTFAETKESSLEKSSPRKTRTMPIAKYIGAVFLRFKTRIGMFLSTKAL